MNPNSHDLPKPIESAPETILFRLEHATLRVGPRHLLPDTNWTLRTGQNWVIMGDNGAGKTTLAGTLTGETPVVAGRRWVDRARLNPSTIRSVSFEAHQRLIARDEKQDEARSFAQRGLHGTSVRTVLETRGRAVGTDGALLDTWWRQAGGSGWLDREIRHLSTGEIRQVMIAHALRAAPRLLIIDEPFDGLDGAARLRLVEMLSALMANGLQMILITHHLDEILPEITHYLMLADGQVTAQGDWEPAMAVPVPSPPSGLCAPVSSVSKASGDQKRPHSGEHFPDLIRMCDVTVHYDGRNILDGFNWCVGRGENWAICGPNGAGKSTLLQLICGDHLQAYANEIYLFGRRRGRGETIWEIKGPIGMVSNALQIRYRKPIDGLAVILSGFFDSVGLYRQARADQVAAAREWAVSLSIEHLLAKDFRRMSNGERRMVLIARAMVKQPILLLLDEPCQGLDPRNRQRLLGMLDTIVTIGPTQLLYVSHRPNEIPAGTTHELHLGGDGTYAIRRRGTR